MTEQDDLDPEKLANVCHERWVKDLHRAMDSADYQDDWRAEQCGACRYFAPVTRPSAATGARVATRARRSIDA